MRLFLISCVLLMLASCAAPPAPVSAPAAPVPASRPASTDRVTETVYVNASALNVRERASTDAAVVAQVKRGASLTVVSRDDGWVQVRLGDGRVGWVAERFVSAEPVAEQQRGGGRAARATVAPSGKRGCESDYSFIETPTLSRGSEADAHGLVVVEATVSAKGIVTATKVISNTTGDPSAGAAAEREIRSARFAPPMRNCEPRAFIFTYRRTF